MTTLFTAAKETIETSAFEFLYGGQFTLSTQLMKPNYLIYSVQCDRILQRAYYSSLKVGLFLELVGPRNY